MKKFVELIGYPFYDANGYPSVYMSMKEGLVTFVYKEDNEYFTSLISHNNLPERNAEVFSEFLLYAKIISIGNSIAYFEGAQRRRDILGSVLRVINYERLDNSNISLSLQTDRRDGTVIKMLTSDVSFIFPTIQNRKRNLKKIIKVGDIIIAVKDSPDKMFKKDDKFDVVKLQPHEMMPSLNLLHLSNKEKNVVTYSKYFKICNNDL